MLDTFGFLGGSHFGRLKLSGVTILPRSKWLCGNTVLVKLEEGEAFYEQRVEVAGPAADTLFAQHLRAQRGILAGDAA